MYKVQKLGISLVREADVITDTITSSKDSANVLREFYNELPGKTGYVESFHVMGLNRANKILGIVQISIGGRSGTIVDASVVFTAALLMGCSSIILCHNHPSGNLNPSDADLKLTKKLTKGGELLDIAVLDHIILTATDSYSFADNGLV